MWPICIVEVIMAVVISSTIFSTVFITYIVIFIVVSVMKCITISVIVIIIVVIIGVSSLLLQLLRGYDAKGRSMMHVFFISRHSKGLLRIASSCMADRSELILQHWSHPKTSPGA